MSGAFCCIAMARIKLKNSQVKDKAPLATDLDVGGEIAVNHHADNPGIFLKDTAGAVRKIAGPGSISTSAATEAAAGIVELATLAETATGTDVTRAVHPAGLKALLSATLTPGSATAPAGPATGATYIDSSVSPAVVAVWDGAAWVKQVGTATTSATAPTAPVTGQVYLDTSTSPAVAKLWNGGAWINLTTDTAVQSKLDAQLGGIWSRTGTVLSPSTAGDQVHADTGKLTVGGTAAAPNIEIKADGGIVANTDGLVYDAATKRLAIGTTSPGSALDVVGDIRLTGAVTTSASNFVYSYGGGSVGAVRSGINLDGSNNVLAFLTTQLERARIDSSGRLLVGTSSSSAEAKFIVQGGATGAGGAVNIQRDATTASAGSTLGVIAFTSSSNNVGATVIAEGDGTWTAGTSHPTRLVFSTTADGASSPTERMRIDKDGAAFIGASALGAAVNYFAYSPGNAFGEFGHAVGVASGIAFARFLYNGGSIGSITQSGATGVAYNTSSDYRLKENVTPVTDGIARLQQLKPSRFNFKADPGHTVDGFIAHEAQAVVPECVTGAKDAVDADGNPVYQGIDQSKMVPLAVAAIQECVKRIEALESEVALLKARP